MRFLTLEELYQKTAGEAFLLHLAGDEPVQGAQNVETALARAEQEAVRELNDDFLLPESSATTPESLKLLVAEAVPYHICAMVMEGEVTEAFRAQERVHQRIMSSYRAAKAPGSDQTLEGIARKSKSPRAGADVQPPPRRYTPWRSGAMDEFLPGR